MAGFNLRNIHRANIGKDVAIQAGEDFIGVAFRPEFQATFVPGSGDKFKRAGFINAGAVRFTKLRRTDIGYQQLTHRIALFAGFRQGNERISAKGQPVFFSTEAIAEIPQLSAAGGYRQIQTLRVSELVGFVEGFSSADLTVIQDHVRVSIVHRTERPAV